MSALGVKTGAFSSGARMRREEAAARFGLHPHAYAMVELDQAPRREIEVVLSSLTDEEPSVGELCAVARWRAGVTLRELHEALGWSKVYYYRMERSGDQRVVAYWRERGFRFP